MVGTLREQPYISDFHNEKQRHSAHDLEACVEELIAALDDPNGDIRTVASRLLSPRSSPHPKYDPQELEEAEVTVPRMPVMSKHDALGFVRSGRMKFQRYQTSNLKVRIYGDAAVVSGRLERTRTLNGTAVEDNWRFTKVYVRRDQRWQVVSFHCSEANSL